MDNATKRKLFLLDAEKYEWCAVNPDKKKHEWPRYKKNGGDLSMNSQACYVCEIVGVDDGGPQCDVKGCIIDWGNTHNDPPCLDNSAAYLQFLKSSGKIRSHYAFIIAETLRLAAAALPEDTKKGSLPWEQFDNCFIAEQNGNEFQAILEKPTLLSKQDWEPIARFVLRAKKFVEKWAREEARRVHARSDTQMSDVPCPLPPCFDKEARDILAGLED